MNSENENSDSPIVSCDWLKAHLHDSDVRIVEASWHMPAAGRDAKAEFAIKHIPGAVFFDIDEHSSPSDLPHMLPDARQFAQAAGSMGIAAHHKIVVYDSLGLFSAARVWWMFRHFGARKVHVLDGGLPAWERAAGALVSLSDIQEPGGDRSAHPDPCEFIVGSSESKRRSEVVDANDVLNSIDKPAIVTLDARSAGRFTGEVKETRKGLRSGHIPGSICLPFTTLLDEQGILKGVPELTSLFDSLQLNQHEQIITTCGSGVTAAVLCLALESAGYSNVALYDGSWTEWGALDSAPVATGD